jgi:uncharacterized secreted protein with C-terminal beta-propeller domain
MSERRGDENAFDGIDGPRALPSDLRDRLVASIVGSAGPFAGIDAPRPLPPSTRQRLESALVRKPAVRRDLRPRILAAAAAFVLLAGVAAAATRQDNKPSAAAIGGTPMERPTDGTTTTTTVPPGAAVVGPFASSEPVVIKLDFKRSCAELLDYFKTNGADRVTAFGLGGNRRIAIDSVPPPPTGGGTAGVHNMSAAASTTNNQEQGVDEPDVVQNDGRFIYVLSGTAVRVIDAGSSPEQLVASVALSQSLTQLFQGMFLTGDRLLVLGNGYAVDDPDTGVGHNVTTVTAVDVSDPTAPSVADSIVLDGYLVSARVIDGRARVVTSSVPTVPTAYPADQSAEASDAALAANRDAVAQSTISQWIGDRPCSSVGLPSEFSGFDLTTVYALNPDALEASESASVAAGGELIYASTSDLYVTSMSWDAWQATDGVAAAPPDVNTQIHRFDITGDAPTYVASGQVNGYVLSQYSLSEQDGDLRVATTNHQQWLPADETTESAVSVLRLVHGELQEVGHVGGLGPGETIQGVRFVGDIGFVVTFQRIWAKDPLFVVDLHDPTDPVVRGALEVTGYSGYLHPIDAGLLVGVGLEGDESGQLTGAQVSVFDVHDLDNPSLVNRVEFPSGYSTATADPHAFLYWAPRSLVVIPLGTSGSTSTEEQAVLLVADGNGVAEVGRVSLPKNPRCDCSYPLDRAVVIGDTLYTISPTYGVQATNLDTLADEGWVEFPT